MQLFAQLTWYFAHDVASDVMLTRSDALIDAVSHVDVIQCVRLQLRRKAADEAAVEAERAQVVSLKQLEALGQREQTCNVGIYGNSERVMNDKAPTACGSS